MPCSVLFPLIMFFYILDCFDTVALNAEIVGKMTSDDVDADIVETASYRKALHRFQIDAHRVGDSRRT